MLFTELIARFQDARYFKFDQFFSLSFISFRKSQQRRSAYPVCEISDKGKKRINVQERAEKVSQSGFHATLTHTKCELWCDLITNRAELANSSVGVEIPLFYVIRENNNLAGIHSMYCGICSAQCEIWGSHRLSMKSGVVWGLWPSHSTLKMDSRPSPKHR